MDWLFPRSSRTPIDFDKLMYDDEGLRFVTFHETAAHVRRWICGLCKEKQIPLQTIVDGTAGLGGNVIGFARSENSFQKVIAIELDANRYYCLKHNVALYRLSHVVSCIHADLVQWYRKEYPAACPGAPIFFDPPWGGDDYRKAGVIRNLHFMTSAESATADEPAGAQKGISLIELLQEIARDKKCPLVILKLPTNFDTNRFQEISGAEAIYPLQPIHRKILDVALFFPQASSVPFSG